MTRAVGFGVLKVKSTLVRPIESVVDVNLNLSPSTADDTHDQWRPSKRFQARSNSTTVVVCLVTIEPPLNGSVTPIGVSYKACKRS